MYMDAFCIGYSALVWAASLPYTMYLVHRCGLEEDLCFLCMNITIWEHCAFDSQIFGCGNING
jgi:hypothetical protein